MSVVWLLSFHTSRKLTFQIRNRISLINGADKNAHHFNCDIEVTGVQICRSYSAIWKIRHTHSHTLTHTHMRTHTRIHTFTILHSRPIRNDKWSDFMATNSRCKIPHIFVFQCKYNDMCEAFPFQSHTCLLTYRAQSDSLFSSHESGK